MFVPLMKTFGGILGNLGYFRLGTTTESIVGRRGRVKEDKFANIRAKFYASRYQLQTFFYTFENNRNFCRIRLLERTLTSGPPHKEFSSQRFPEISAELTLELTFYK